MRIKWLYSDKSGCIWARVVVFGHKWLYLGKMVVFGQNCYIRGRWLYLSKNGCVRTKLVVFGQKWLFSGNLVVFGKSACIRAKLLYLGEMIVLGQKWS